MIFLGGMGKRAWNSGFSGMGKRAWNSGFSGMGKRSTEEFQDSANEGKNYPDSVNVLPLPAPLLSLSLINGFAILDRKY